MKTDINVKSVKRRNHERKSSWSDVSLKNTNKENNNNKLDITKIKYFCSMKETMQKTKGTPWEKNTQSQV